MKAGVEAAPPNKIAGTLWGPWPPTRPAASGLRRGRGRHRRAAGWGWSLGAVAVVMRASRVRSGSHCCFCNKSPQTRNVFHQSVLRLDRTACLLVLRQCCNLVANDENMSYRNQLSLTHQYRSNLLNKLCYNSNHAGHAIAWMIEY